jgi:hypothetical protein
LANSAQTLEFDRILIWHCGNSADCLQQWTWNIIVSSISFGARIEVSRDIAQSWICLLVNRNLMMPISIIRFGGSEWDNLSGFVEPLEDAAQASCYNSPVRLDLIRGSN